MQQLACDVTQMSRMELRESRLLARETERKGDQQDFL